jgi:hypothetical protein
MLTPITQEEREIISVGFYMAIDHEYNRKFYANFFLQAYVTNYKFRESVQFVITVF